MSWFTLFLVNNYWLFFIMMQFPAFFLLLIDVLYYIFVVHPYLFAHYHVIVYEEREGGWAKGRKCYGTIRKDETGTDKVWLTKYKVFIQIPEPTYLVALNNRQDLLELVRDKNRNFIPKAIWDSNNKPEITKINTTVIRWGQQERKAALERLIVKDEHWIKQYWPQIGVMLVFVATIMAFILVGYYSNEMVQKTVGIASAQMNQQFEISNKYARIFLYAMGEESLPEDLIYRAPAVVNVTPQADGGFMGLGLLPS